MFFISWGTSGLFLVFWEFFSWMGVGFYKILFLHLLIPCDFSSLACSCSELHKKRTCKIYSQQLSNTQYSIVNCSHCAAHDVPRTYSSYNWKFSSPNFATKTSFHSRPISLLRATNAYHCPCVCLCVGVWMGGLDITVVESGSLFRLESFLAQGSS